MIRTIALLLFAAMSSGSYAQTYTLPIANQDEFLDNTSNYMFSVTVGRLFPFNKESESNIKPGFGFRLGYAERRITFDDNVVFTDDNGELAMTVNDNPDIEYPNSFFRRGFTRLEGEYFRIGGSLGFIIADNLQISGGINADFRAASKFRNKFFENDDRMRTKLKGNHLLQLNGQQFAWVVQAGFQGISLSYEMSLNPFFAEAWGLDSYRFSSFGVVYGF